MIESIKDVRGDLNKENPLSLEKQDGFSAEQIMDILPGAAGTKIFSVV